METKRLRGRPARVRGDAGRDAVLAAAVKMLRARPRTALIRKELAIEAGVTSNLITYYFKEQSSLIEAAVKPIIDGYLKRLRSIVAQECSSEQQFRFLIIFLLQVARSDGFLLDKFIAHANSRKRDDTAVEFLREGRDAFGKILKRCQAANYLRQYDVDTLQTAIWGICRSIALAPQLSKLVSNPPSKAIALEEWEADTIVDLLIFGIGGSAVGASTSSVRDQRETEQTPVIRKPTEGLSVSAEDAVRPLFDLRY